MQLWTVRRFWEKQKASFAPLWRSWNCSRASSRRVLGCLWDSLSHSSEKTELLLTNKLKCSAILCNLLTLRSLFFNICISFVKQPLRDSALVIPCCWRCGRRVVRSVQPSWLDDAFVCRAKVPADWTSLCDVCVLCENIHAPSAVLNIYIFFNLPEKEVRPKTTSFIFL